MEGFLHCSLAAGRRWQFVTNCGSHLPSSGPLDRNMSANCSLASSWVKRKSCHSERSTKCGVEESSHYVNICSQIGAKILRLAGARSGWQLFCYISINYNLNRSIESRGPEDRWWQPEFVTHWLSLQKININFVQLNRNLIFIPFIR